MQGVRGKSEFLDGLVLGYGEEGCASDRREKAEVERAEGSDLGVPKHVRTLACLFGTLYGGDKTVERNNDSLLDPSVPQTSGLPTPQYFLRKGGLRAIELLHRTPKAGTMRISFGGLP